MRSYLVASLLLLTSVSATPSRVEERQDPKNPKVTGRPDSKYDFIVVGSGPGGGPLAANLAKANFSVLLIEAGDDHGDSLNQQVPAFHNQAMNDPSQRWDYFVKHYSDDSLNNAYPYNTWKMSDGSYYVGTSAPSGAKKLGVYYPRAGTLGGCSTHNAMAAVLPADSDWDYIAQLTQDKTWNSTRMHKFFSKIEHNNYLPNGTAGHGFTGYLGTSQADPSLLDSAPAFKAVVQAAATAGSATGDLTSVLTKDLNSPDSAKDGAAGFSGFAAHIDAQGRRVSSRTYISSIYNATNPDGSKKYKLDIWLNTLASKIIFTTPDNSNVTNPDFAVQPTAIGVEYLQGSSLYSADPRSKGAAGTKAQVYAKKEIIISAGVFNSPQILKLSGIGPADELKKFNIPVVVDAPGVGANLQDNQEYSVVSLAQQPITPQSKCTNGAANDPCLADWQQGKGPYTQGPSNAMLIKTTQSQDGERDLMVWVQQNVFRGFWPQANGMPAAFPNTAVSINMAKIHPRASSGTVTLKSNDPRDTPDINFNFFSSGADQDLQAMLEGVQWGRKLLQGISGPVGPFSEIFPCSANSTTACGDSDIKSLIKQDTWSHHAVGTVAIGSSNDTNAVLNGKFEVLGVHGLRVVDASVFPKQPGAFPVLPTFMVAEKATEVILLNEKKKARQGMKMQCNAGAPHNATKILLQGRENINLNLNSSMMVPTHGASV